MEATTLKPRLASSTAVSSPIPLEEPVITANFVDMESNIGSFVPRRHGFVPGESGRRKESP